jgi:excinuclease ABC subunit C
LSGLKAAGAEEIAQVEGINQALAERIYATLHGLQQAGHPPSKDEPSR